MNKQLTNNTYTLNLGAEGKEHKIWNVAIQDLFFNSRNGRIAREMIQRGYEHKSARQLDLEVQKDVEECFEQISKNDANYAATKKSILENMQVTPVVINPNGIVIDGNTRLFLIKKLIQENQLNQNTKIKAIILSKNYEGYALERLETTIQFLHLEKIQYSAINRKLKWDSMNKQNIDRGLSRKKSYEIIAEAMPGFSIANVKEGIHVLDYMRKVLTKFDKEIDYEFLGNQNGHFEWMMKAEEFIGKTPELKSKLADFEKTAFSQIETGATLIGLFRKIMPCNKKKSEWMLNDQLFERWVKETEKCTTKADVDELNFRIMQQHKEQQKSKLEERVEENQESNTLTSNLKNNNLFPFQMALERLEGQMDIISENKNDITPEMIQKLENILNIIKS